MTTEPGPKVQSDLGYAIQNGRTRGTKPPGTPVLEAALSDKNPLKLGDHFRRDGPSAGIPIGLIDRPLKQEQVTLGISFQEGAAAFVGGIATGKTTALVTSARSFLEYTPEGFVVFIDGGGGDLEGVLAGTEQVTAISGGLRLSALDVGRTTLFLDRLSLLLRKRTDPSGAATPILVVVDEVEQLVSALAANRGASWFRALVDIVSQGRNRGVFFVFSAGRLSDVPVELRSLTKSVIALGGIDEVGGRRPSEQGSPGIGRDRFGDSVQICLPICDEEFAIAPGPGKVFEDLDSILPLDRTLTVSEEGDSVYVPLGVLAVSREPVNVELGWRHLLVVGPPRSGKSSVILQLAERLQLHKGGPALLFAGRPRTLPSPLPASLRLVSPETVTDLKTGASLASLPSIRSFLDAVFAEIAPPEVARFGEGADSRVMIFVDDVHVLERDRSFKEFLELLIQYDRACVVMASDVGAGGSRDWVGLKTQSSQTIFLRPASTSDNDDGSRVLGDVLRIRPGFNFGPGAGILYSQRSQSQFQAYFAGALVRPRGGSSGAA